MQLLHLHRETARLHDQECDASALRRIFDEHALLSIADRSGTIREVNPGFCRISGYDEAELVGQDHRVLNSGHHPKSFWIDMWKTVASGEAWRGEVCNRRKDGSLYWVDSTIIPQRDTSGKIDRYISLRFDITEQRNAVAELREFRSILDRSNDAIFMFDAESLGFVYTNRGACEQIGYTEDELREMTPVDIKPEYDEAGFRALIEPLVEKPGTSSVLRPMHRHKDGT